MVTPGLESATTKDHFMQACFAFEPPTRHLFPFFRSSTTAWYSPGWIPASYLSFQATPSLRTTLGSAFWSSLPGLRLPFGPTLWTYPSPCDGILKYFEWHTYCHRVQALTTRSVGRTATRRPSTSTTSASFFHPILESQDTSVIFTFQASVFA